MVREVSPLLNVALQRTASEPPERTISCSLCVRPLRVARGPLFSLERSEHDDQLSVYPSTGLHTWVDRRVLLIRLSPCSIFEEW